MFTIKVLNSLAQQSRRFLSTIAKGASSSPGAAPWFPFYPPARGPVIEDVPTTSNVPWVLPSSQRNAKLYSFPTPEKVSFEMPTMPGLIEKVDPAVDIVPISDPTISKKSPMYAGHWMYRMNKLRRKKEAKKKRIRKMWSHLESVKLEKRTQSERIFRAKMTALLTGLDNFDPLEYVKSVIKKADAEWHTELAPSGRKKYPHWSQLITRDEAFNLEKALYIDKRSGLPPTPEQAQEIERLRKEYRRKYVLAPVRNKRRS